MGTHDRRQYSVRDCVQSDHFNETTGEQVMVHGAGALLDLLGNGDYVSGYIISIDSRRNWAITF